MGLYATHTLKLKAAIQWEVEQQYLSILYTVDFSLLVLHCYLPVLLFLLIYYYCIQHQNTSTLFFLCWATLIITLQIIYTVIKVLTLNKSNEKGSEKA